jgi:hypothetical protein
MALPLATEGLGGAVAAAAASCPLAADGGDTVLLAIVTMVQTQGEAASFTAVAYVANTYGPNREAPKKVGERRFQAPLQGPIQRPT